MSDYSPSMLDRVLAALAKFTEDIRVWHRWPFLPAVILVLGHRVNLRRNNLTDTETAKPSMSKPDEFDITGWRTYDGTFNDMADPWMGAKGARFGRNVPLKSTYGEKDPELYDPSPRLISNKLLARQSFQPVPHLNVFAAAWIQFMVHDWLSHGANDKNNLLNIPVPDDDDWAHGPMQIPATKPDPDTGPGDEGRPATYRNVETHWWDASQIYGSSKDVCDRLRTDPDTGDFLQNGKLWLDENGHLPLDPKSQEKQPGLELAGVNGNWWIGLSALHTLFAREHNAIVDRLTIDHPKESGEWLFQKARLVNSALLAKIHTVEWTPALMDSDKGRMLMRGNYWGLTGERYAKIFDRISESEVVHGIMGSPTDHHGAPFTITEEFTAVYRLHSLLPDDFSFRKLDDNSTLHETDLHGVSMGAARGIYDKASFQDVFYSLATSNPGALTLHNYPNGLRTLQKRIPVDRVIDLAAVDILRDRERGVPRFAEFRRLTGMKEPKTFADITDNKEWQKQLAEVYDDDVEKVDLLVGTLAESQSERGQPYRFGFSDTAFRIFILMASRRLKSDRFFTDDFRPEVYTEVGLAWVKENGFRSVVERHLPELTSAMADARNPFFPWKISKT
ncbi:peroxidase family protein [Roseibium sp. MMSF_3544]|uniref:peroxidase family protein n=1 Tax=unclassified Roseibium TaxID=2629323 RepID=UPI00274021EA|nr:peroxidase family protein [Roseibium sp. MMSF_3544]